MRHVRNPFPPSLESESMSKDRLLLAGRVLIAVLFVPGGFAKLSHFQNTVASIAHSALPLPSLMAAGAIAVEFGVGLAFLVGWKARWAALILALFTLVAGVFFHNFWAAPDAQVAMQKINFLKNLAIAGGLFFVYVFGPGRLSIDRG
ncbi:MAG: DoxX family protein [Burkholderiales bacterium]